MPYTFGAGTGDDINWSPVMQFNGTVNMGFAYGWWFPTTLTSTRGLWSIGNVFGAEVNSTTDEVRLRTDNTTDGQWTTTGVDMVVNEWRFIAFAWSLTNTGPAATWKVWAGNLDNPPVACAVAQATAPVGNFTGGGALYVGNKGTGTLAFQGDVAHFGAAGDDAQVHPTSLLNLATNGAISATEEQYILERFVIPAYLGEYRWMWPGSHGIGTQGVTGGTGLCGHHNNLDLGAQPVWFGPAAINQYGSTVTINGATWSQRRAPRPGIAGSGSAWFNPTTRRPHRR